MDDWEEVFMQAAGGSVTTSGAAAGIDNTADEGGTNGSKQQQERKQQQQQQERKKRKNRHLSDSVSATSTTSTPPPFIDGLRKNNICFGTSFTTIITGIADKTNHTKINTTNVSYNCKQYKCNDDNNNQTVNKNQQQQQQQQHTETVDDCNMNDNNIYHYNTTNCITCLQPSGYHQMLIIQQQQQTPLLFNTLHNNNNSNNDKNHEKDLILSLFITIRNLRCYCRLHLILFFQQQQQQQPQQTHHDAIDTSNKDDTVVLASKTTDTTTELQQYELPTNSYIQTYINEISYILLNYNNNNNTKNQDLLLCNISIRNLQLLVQHIQQNIEIFTTTTFNHSSSRVPVNTKQQQQQQQEQQHNSINFFITHVQCIMKCDEIYNRLYYNDRTTTGTTNNNYINDVTIYNNNTNNNFNHHHHYFTIPNPLTYYSEWVNINDRKDYYILSLNIYENPLYRIYLYRMLETISIFNQEWIESITLKNTSLLSKDDTYLLLLQKCKIEWDLSCRDFLCHLYCYCTLSNHNIKNIILYLQKYFNCYNIIEIGAGTGYLSYWFNYIGQQLVQDNGYNINHTLNVTSYDIATTTKFNPSTTTTTKNSKKLSSSPPQQPTLTNEYHADMAGYYYTVQYGTTYTYLDHYYKSNKSMNNLNNNTTPALLLCYPPPNSSMGYEAIRQYHLYNPNNNNNNNNNNHNHTNHLSYKVIIYIGEYKGLTGNEQMEQYILKHFVCRYRIPCNLYGSADASFLYIYIDKNRYSTNTPQRSLGSVTSSAVTSTNDMKLQLLVPCTNCKSKESIRRCINFRSLVYCCNNCFHLHTKQRQELEDRTDVRVQLSIRNHSFIHDHLIWSIMKIKELQFDNPKHFETLYTR